MNGARQPVSGLRLKDDNAIMDKSMNTHEG